MSVPDKAMKLKDGKIIADQLSSMIAVQFVQATANAAGSYVVYNGEVFYLPEGHTAGTTWANTTKEGPTNIGEINTQLKNAIQGKYTKPSGGIPKTDLASDVQTSLGKADTALQANDVATAVDAWCDENITNPDSPPLDRSLTSSSAAAPADIVGELKTALSNRFGTYDKVLNENNQVIMNFELGYVSVSGTALNWWADNKNNLRTIKDHPISLFAGDTLIFDDSTYRCQIIYSTDSGTTWVSTGWITASPYSFKKTAIGYVEIGRKANTDISNAINTVYNALKVYRGQYEYIFASGDMLPYALDNNGEVTDGNSSIRKTTDFIKVSGKFTVSSDNYICVYKYNAAKEFVSKSADWVFAEYGDHTGYIRIMENTSSNYKEVTVRFFNDYSQEVVGTTFGSEKTSGSNVFDSVITVSASDLMSMTLDNNGEVTTQNTNGRFTSDYIRVVKGTVVTCNTMAVFEYDNKKTFVTKNSGWVNSYVVQNDGYIRVMEYSSNGTGRNITIRIPYQINPAYIQEVKEQKKTPWSNRWLFDVSHRGYSRYIAPDTKPAYVQSKVKGYNGIEGDIRVTTDGEYVIHHDDGMPSNSSYKISEHTLAELRANANMGYYNGETLNILTLKEWLLLAKNTDMFVFAELKITPTDAQVTEIMTIARNCGMQDRVAWIVTASKAQAFREFYPLCYLAISDSLDYESLSQYVIEEHPERTIVYTRCTNITETLVANCENVGLCVIGWCVSFDWMFGEGEWTETSVKTEIKRALACGAKGMTLDYWTLAEIYAEEYAAYI